MEAHITERCDAEFGVRCAKVRLGVPVSSAAAAHILPFFHLKQVLLSSIVLKPGHGAPAMPLCVMVLKSIPTSFGAHTDPGLPQPFEQDVHGNR